jgi:hypothetical protein
LGCLIGLGRFWGCLEKNELKMNILGKNTTSNFLVTFVAIEFLVVDDASSISFFFNFFIKKIDG